MCNKQEEILNWRSILWIMSRSYKKWGSHAAVISDEEVQKIKDEIVNEETKKEDEI